MRRARHNGTRRGGRSGRAQAARPAWWLAVAVAVTFALLPTVAAASGEAAEAAEAPAGSVVASVAVPASVAAAGPNIRKGVPPAVAQKLQQAFALAAKRVQERPACRALFEKFGKDGGRLISATLFFPAKGPQAKRRFCVASDALTQVGASVTWLCPSFGSLANDRAAMVLIHEALHFAGLTESPAEAGAMTSTQINDLVKESCD